MVNKVGSPKSYAVYFKRKGYKNYAPMLTYKSGRARINKLPSVERAQKVGKTFFGGQNKKYYSSWKVKKV